MVLLLFHIYSEGIGVEIKVILQISYKVRIDSIVQLPICSCSQYSCLRNCPCPNLYANVCHVCTSLSPVAKHG